MLEELEHRLLSVLEEEGPMAKSIWQRKVGRWKDGKKLEIVGAIDGLKAKGLVISTIEPYRLGAGKIPEIFETTLKGRLELGGIR